MLDAFSPATRTWFDRAFDAPTPVQTEGWAKIAAGDDVLLLAPTGSGKTLAAFLWAIDSLGKRTVDGPSVRTVYVSPLKALVYDVERNLRAPLVGISREAARSGHAFRPPRVAMRTGDTPQSDRRRLRSDPTEILVTTPESLYLLMSSGAREILTGVDTIILDEVHAIAGSKRGAHLALTLERLAERCETPPQRIGLSATVRPIKAVAHYLGGGRKVAIVDTSKPPHLDLKVVVPVRNLDRPAPVLPDPAQAPLMTDYGEDGMGYGAFQQPTPPRGIWPVIVPKLLEAVQSHRSTIVFVNSRSLCERLAARINELDGGEEELVKAHHGSVSHSQRSEIEEALKSGLLRGIVATSSLELGIDMGAVDLVIQIESPRSTARGLQRVGRAGHGVGERSQGLIFPKFRGDLLEATVVARRMRRGQLEPISIPRNPLDVLSQQIVAMCALDTWALDHLETVIRRSWSYRDLSRAALIAVLDMLAGRYPSTDFADLRPRILWDREKDLLSERKGSRQLVVQNAGTIPDRGLFTVHLGEGGPRIGELDEEMVHESRAGETIVLGASTWRVEDITRDRVIVSPAPGEPGRMPFWHGAGPGRPIELGRAQGELLRELSERTEDEAREWLREASPLDEMAVENVLDYVGEQREATGTLPTDKTIVIERFRDELGDWRVCILTPFGAPVHAPWALALESKLSESSGFEVSTMWSDDGIVLRLADAGEDSPLPEEDVLVPDPDEVEERIVEQLGSSPLFATVFREAAGCALLLPRRSFRKRQPLWAQRLKAQSLMAAAKQYPAFPIILETYRSCLQDHFDVPALIALLRQIRSREVRVVAVETTKASPFARSLVFRYVAEYMYDGDTPNAERRAQALTLDRDLLRDLLGQEELRSLLDAGEIASLEAVLQCLVPVRHARHADALHDMLRRLGDLTLDEARERAAEDPEPWLVELQAQRRVAEVRVGDEPRWIAAEDCGRYRDALGAVPPSGIPKSFLENVKAPLRELLSRFARTNGPFAAEGPALRFGVPVAEVLSVLDRMVSDNILLEGGFRPGGRGREFCDPEVLRRIRQRTLAKLRGEVAPVDGDALARFVASWQGLDTSRGHAFDRLRDALVQLEGVFLPYSEFEGRILPARVPGFTAQLLDELGASGAFVWVGRGALGAKDGRVAVFRREALSLLFTPEDHPEDDETHVAIKSHLSQSGASFLSDLSAAIRTVSLSDLKTALWDLVWQGRVTNDTFQVLRGRGKPTSKRSVPSRRGWRSTAAGGRWSLVERLVHPASDTERAHAMAMGLLERYGIVSREVAHAENIPGGFSAVYKVMRAMEEAGKARRGWFVEGLQGAQFALPGAVDRLRAVRNDSDAPVVRVLAATDPAQPYGTLLPWPGVEGARRVAGASVVTVDGHAVLYIAKGGKRMLVFPAAEDTPRLAAAMEALKPIARRTRGAALRVEKINGESAGKSEWAETFERAGFGRGLRGLVLEG